MPVNIISDMEMKEIRVKNLNYLIKKYGRKAVAEASGYAEGSFFGQLVVGIGSFGPKVAKKFEAAYGLPDFWMSTPHIALWDDGTGASGQDIDLLIEELEGLIPLLPEGEQQDKILHVINRISRLAPSRSGS